MWQRIARPGLHRSPMQLLPRLLPPLPYVPSWLLHPGRGCRLLLWKGCPQTQSQLWVGEEVVVLG